MCAACAVQGTAIGAEIHLGAGNDKIIYYGKGAVIETGQGADIVGLHGFGLITDLSPEDKIWYTEGKQIFGGYRFSSSENPWAFDIWGNAFGLNGAGELLIGKAGIETSEREERSLFVSNFDPALRLGGMSFFEILVDFVPFSDFVIDPLFQGTGGGVGGAVEGVQHFDVRPARGRSAGEALENRAKENGRTTSTTRAAMSL